MAKPPCLQVVSSLIEPDVEPFVDLSFVFRAENREAVPLRAWRLYALSRRSVHPSPQSPQIAHPYGKVLLNLRRPEEIISPAEFFLWEKGDSTRMNSLLVKIHLFPPLNTG